MLMTVAKFSLALSHSSPDLAQFQPALSKRVRGCMMCQLTNPVCYYNHDGTMFVSGMTINYSLT